MIGKIYNALAVELKSFVDNSNDYAGTEVIRSTQAKQKDQVVSSINLIVVELENSHDVFQCIGGVSQVELNFKIHAFFYDENSALSDDSGYNEKAYKLVDDIRRYMAATNWATTEMQNCINDYGIKFTLNGQIKSSELAISGGGIIPGYSLNYESVALDTDTDQADEKTFANQLNEGTTTEQQIKYNWLSDINYFVADLTAYNALTTANIGDRVYISALNKIYTVLTIDNTTHFITSSSIYVMQTNDIFINKADGKCWTWSGTALVRKYQITITALP